MKHENTKKNIIRGLATIGVYFILPLFNTLPFDLLHIDLNYVPTIVKSIYMGIYELLMLSLIILIFHELIIEKWKDLKKHHQEYFQTYFKYWFLLIGLMMASNFLIMTFSNDFGGATNQNDIIDMFGKSPIYTYLSAVFFAPIVEELVFRQAIRNLIPKWNILFIIISGFIFGGLHVVGATSVSQFFYIIPYSIPGLVFAYILTKTDNIFTTIGLHFFHNGLLMALQVFILLFG